MKRSLLVSTYSKLPRESLHDNFRELTLDKQFKELVDKCNRSKAELEHVTKALSLKDQSATRKTNLAKSPGVRSPFRNVIIEDLSPQKFVSSPNEFRRSPINEGFLLSKRSGFESNHTRPKRLREASDEDDVNENIGSDSIQNIRELKWMLKDQKQLDNISYTNLKTDYEGLKINLAKYIDKVDRLRQLDKQKDKHLLNLEEQYQSNCDVLAQRKEDFPSNRRPKREFKEDDVEVLLTEYNFNLSQQKQTIESIETTITKEENEYQQTKEIRVTNNRELKREADLLKVKEGLCLEENKSRKENKERLESTLDSFNIISQEMKNSERDSSSSSQLLREQIGSINIQNTSLKQQISELEALIELNEKKELESEENRRCQKQEVEKQYLEERKTKKQQGLDIKGRIKRIEAQKTLDLEDLKSRRAELTEFSIEFNSLDKDFREKQSEQRDIEAERKQIVDNTTRITNSNSELLANYDREVQKLKEAIGKKGMTEVTLNQKQEKLERENKALLALEKSIDSNKEQKVSILRTVNERKAEALDLEVRLDDIKSVHDIKIKEAEKDFDHLCKSLLKAQKENQDLKNVGASTEKDIRAMKTDIEQLEQMLVDINNERDTIESNIEAKKLLILALDRQKEEKRLVQQRKQRVKTEADRKAQLLDDISLSIQKYRIDKIKTDSSRPVHSVYFSRE